MKDRLSLFAAKVIWWSGSLLGARWAIARLRREGFTLKELARLPRP